MIMIEHIRMVQIPYLDIWSMLLSGQVIHRLIEAIKVIFLESWEDPLLNTVLLRGNQLTSYYWWVFSIKWFQCKILCIICCIYILLNSWRHSKFMHQWWVISPTNDKNNAELNRQFPFDTKKNIARLTHVKNEGREAWHTIFVTCISKWSKGTVWH